MQAKSIFTGLLAAMIPFYSIAQEQLGLKLGNYGGVHSLQLNPAWQVNGPLKWDVNIVSFGAFAEQDYVYGQKGSMVRLLNRGGNVITEDTPAGGDAMTSSGEVPFYFRENSHYNINQLFTAMAPSFMANMGSHSFGLYFTGRTFSSGYKLDDDFYYFTLTDTLDLIGNFEPFQLGAMAWSEIGASYAKNISSKNWLEMNAGATIKFLLGFDAASVSNNTATDAFRDGDILALGPADLTMNYSTGYSDAGGYAFQRRGFGLATDIGITWLSRDASTENRQYRWKVGLSLLDVGRIWYTGDASVYRYDSPDSSYFSTNDFRDVGDPDEFIAVINNSGNSAQAEMTAAEFGMWMPMAASIQFDAPLADRFYIAGTAVIGMRFPNSANALERSDLLAVTPRFETRWFEIGLPVSLYRWKDIRMGTYMRIGPLTIGTENLNSWIIPGRLEGSDIYVALKIHSGMLGKNCRSKNRGSRRGQGCYSNL
jgi:hypothetical protein